MNRTQAHNIFTQIKIRFYFYPWRATIDYNKAIDTAADVLTLSLTWNEEKQINARLKKERGFNLRMIGKQQKSCGPIWNEPTVYQCRLASTSSA
jgi:hypothetical protein